MILVKDCMCCKVHSQKWSLASAEKNITRDKGETASQQHIHYSSWIPKQETWQDFEISSILCTVNLLGSAASALQTLSYSNTHRELTLTVCLSIEWIMALVCISTSRHCSRTSKHALMFLAVLMPLATLKPHLVPYHLPIAPPSTVKVLDDARLSSSPQDSPEPPATSYDPISCQEPQTP